VALAWKGLFRLTRRRALRALQPLPQLRAYRFNGDYREKLTLSDGTILWVRLLRVGDRSCLQAGMRGLSEQSRYLRFHSAKTELTHEELRYLTEIDYIRHFALIVYRRVGIHREGVAVARYVCFPGTDTRAEAALTVADAYQGKGLGKLLLERLCAAGVERGVVELVGEVLSSNRAARHLLQSHFQAICQERNGPTETWLIDINRSIRNI